MWTNWKVDCYIGNGTHVMLYYRDSLSSGIYELEYQCLVATFGSMSGNKEIQNALDQNLSTAQIRKLFSASQKLP